MKQKPRRPGRPGPEPSQAGGPAAGTGRGRAASPDRLFVPGLFLGALLVRLYGLGWGLPETYEEATPLTLAWNMWGWGPHRSFDPNPHFFNYPSFTFYLQLVVQGILYLAMTVTGMVHSTDEFVARYVTDPTPFYWAGRAVTACFGAGAVVLTWHLAKKLGGLRIAIPAALLLALSPAHIAASQVVEVDVPLAFFSLLTLLLAVSYLERPSLRNAVMTGIAAGLAASTKYTGAFLVLPIALAHGIAWKSDRKKGARAPGDFVLALGVMLVAFFVTSPYVFLDFQTFQAHLMKERVHMRLGHFGLDSAPAWLFYLEALARRMVTIPGLILALVGLVTAVFVRRDRRAILLASFVLPYTLVISGWEMRADRYILPALPFLFIFLATGLDDGLRFLARSWSETLRSRVVLGGAAAIALLAFGTNAGYLDRLKPSTQHLAREWIEKNLPPGSFVATELHGPQLLDPDTLVPLETPVRKAVQSTAPVYAVQKIPMFQVKPELSAIYYDPAVYRIADVVITSSLVRDRYASAASQFAPQIAFYDTLEARWPKAATFAPGRNTTGPVVTIYRNPAKPQPFASRKEFEHPPKLKDSGSPPNGKESSFYYSLGLNCEIFGHPGEALEAYNIASSYPPSEPGLFSNIVLGAVRCLLSTGHAKEAEGLVARASTMATTDVDRKAIQQLAASLRRR